MQPIDLAMFHVKLRPKPGCACEGVDAFFLLPMTWLYLLLLANADESVR